MLLLDWVELKLYLMFSFSSWEKREANTLQTQSNQGLGGCYIHIIPINGERLSRSAQQL